MSIDRNIQITDYAWCFANPERAASAIGSLTAQLKIVRDELEELKKQEPVGYFAKDMYSGQYCQFDELLNRDLLMPLYARQIPSIPDGMALLPIEPTDDMVLAGRKKVDELLSNPAIWTSNHPEVDMEKEEYKAMIEEYLKCNKQQSK